MYIKFPIKLNIFIIDIITNIPDKTWRINIVLSFSLDENVYSTCVLWGLSSLIEDCLNILDLLFELVIYDILLSI